jgi:hypothetical protein
MWCWTPFLRDPATGVPRNFEEEDISVLITRLTAVMNSKYPDSGANIVLHEVQANGGLGLCVEVFDESGKSIVETPPEDDDNPNVPAESFEPPEKEGPSEELQHIVDRLIFSSRAGPLQDMAIGFTASEDGALGVPLWYQQMILRFEHFKHNSGRGTVSKNVHVGVEPLADDNGTLHWYISKYVYTEDSQFEIMRFIKNLYVSGAVVTTPEKAVDLRVMSKSFRPKLVLAAPTVAMKPVDLIRTLA